MRSLFKKMHSPTEGRMGFSGRKKQMNSDKKKERPVLKEKFKKVVDKP